MAECEKDHIKYFIDAHQNRVQRLYLQCDQATANEIYIGLGKLGLRVTQPREPFHASSGHDAEDGNRYRFKIDVLVDMSEEVVRSHIDNVIDPTQDGNGLYVIRNVNYSYVLLNGDDPWMQYVKSTLEGMNLSIKREGESFRPAANGIQYSWFLRLEKPIDPEDEDQIYEELSKQKYQEHIPVSDTGPELIELQDKLNSATDEIERAQERERELEQLNAEACEELRRTQIKLQSTEEQLFNNNNLRQAYNTLERSFEKSRIEIENLESELKIIRLQDAQGHHGELPAATVEEYEHEISALREMNEVQETEISALRKINEKRETENREFLEQRSEILTQQQEYYELLTEEQNRCRSLNTDKVFLQDELSQMKTVLYNNEQRILQLTSELDLIQASENNAEPLDQSIYERMISLCLPKVEFVDRSSIPFLYNEVNDIDKVLVLLTRLHYEGSPQLDQVGVAGQKGWWETKFDTGPSQRNYGRIYYKRRGDKLKVLISEKDSQKHDIGRLPSD